MSLPIPAGFKPLQEAYETEVKTPLNIIGVCADFKDAIRSRGADMTIQFTLHDPSWPEGLGLPVRFFHKLQERLPKVTSTGDVIILRNVKNTEYRGERCSFSNSASSWVVLEYESVKNSTCSDGTDIVTHLSGQPPHLAPRPSILELRYAKSILALEDPTQWRTPLITTKSITDMPSAQSAQNQSPSDVQRRFCLIKDASLPYGRAYVFRDLFGEVRKIWDNGMGDRCELSVTDYTENPHLFDYRHSDVEDGNGYDYGDRFGYVDSTCKLWPGPWGKMTIAVTCWQPHCGYVLKNVQAGDYVSISNVQIKFDKNGTRLEGMCRTDINYPGRVNVQISKRSEAEGNDRFKELLKRKRDYEEFAKEKNLRFIRDARTIRPHKLDDTNDKENVPPNTKSSKNRNKKDRKKNKKTRAGAASEEDAMKNRPGSKALAANANIRCNAIDIPLTRLSTVLDPSILVRDTPAGHRFHLPFQNSCYKSKIRVVDYFPDNLANFCAPVIESAYAALPDNDSESDLDITQSTPDLVRDDVRWEWRFCLLVEDARPTPGMPPVQMELLVCGLDGDYLLKEDACDLSRNAHNLAKLTETLFHLWGDLQEQKEAMKEAVDVAALKPNGRPFECFIKEYGVPSVEERGKKEDDVKRWERMFRLCMTTIQRV